MPTIAINFLIFAILGLFELRVSPTIYPYYAVPFLLSNPSNETTSIVKIYYTFILYDNYYKS